jgi:hypothetical protein
MKQTIEPPNADESSWITENLELAKKIVATYAHTADLGPDSLDEVLSAWSSHGEAERIEPNALVNALGIAFGQFLIQELQLRWAVVIDEHGTDIAVHGSPSEILIFPTSAVAKRIEKGELSFFRDLFQQLSGDIRKLRRQVH